VIGEFLFRTACPPVRCDPDATVRRIALIHAVQRARARPADRGGTLPAAAKRAFAVTHLLRLVTPVPDARKAGLPLNYLLFDHARLTYNRVGTSRDNEGFAARLLRSALVHGDISRREPAAA
jgi:hypothetical protein